MTIPWWYRSASRVRWPVTIAGPALVVAAVAVALLGGSGALVVSLAVLAVVCIAAGIALNLTPYRPDIPPRTVESPIRGPWVPVNSPDAKVPSHGTHSTGQTFAVDLVYDPGAVEWVGEGSAQPRRPRFGEGKGFRPPVDFPGFGQPVYAPAAGRVVSTRDGARDHLSRSNWVAYSYMIIEGMLRELAGSRFLLGNHLVVDIGEGCFAVLAHLKQGSISVRSGDDIASGQPVAQVGNSGNSTEPHLHFQLMDGPHPATAAGLPFAFRFTGLRWGGLGSTDSEVRRR